MEKMKDKAIGLLSEIESSLLHNGVDDELFALASYTMATLIYIDMFDLAEGRVWYKRFAEACKKHEIKRRMELN